VLDGPGWCRGMVRVCVQPAKAGWCCDCAGCVLAGWCSAQPFLLLCAGPGGVAATVAPWWCCGRVVLCAGRVLLPVCACWVVLWLCGWCCVGGVVVSGPGRVASALGVVGCVLGGQIPASCTHRTVGRAVVASCTSTSHPPPGSPLAPPSRSCCCCTETINTMAGRPARAMGGRAEGRRAAGQGRVFLVGERKKKQLRRPPCSLPAPPPLHSSVPAPLPPPLRRNTGQG